MINLLVQKEGQRSLTTFLWWDPQLIIRIYMEGGPFELWSLIEDLRAGRVSLIGKRISHIFEQWGVDLLISRDTGVFTLDTEAEGGDSRKIVSQLTRQWDAQVKEGIRLLVEESPSFDPRRIIRSADSVEHEFSHVKVDDAFTIYTLTDFLSCLNLKQWELDLDRDGLPVHEVLADEDNALLMITERIDYSYDAQLTWRKGTYSTMVSLPNISSHLITAIMEEGMKAVAIVGPDSTFCVGASLNDEGADGRMWHSSLQPIDDLNTELVSHLKKCKVYATLDRYKAYPYGGQEELGEQDGL